MLKAAHAPYQCTGTVSACHYVTLAELVACGAGAYMTSHGGEGATVIGALGVTREDASIGRRQTAE
jgi:hypothetical protein